MRNVRRYGRYLVPRTNDELRSNEVYRWTNRVIWIVIVLMAVVAYLTFTPS